MTHTAGRGRKIEGWRKREGESSVLFSLNPFCFYSDTFVERSCHLFQWLSMVLLQDILDLAETHLRSVSSAVVCRKLSSIGRRVLSIESFSASQGHCTTVHRIHLFGSGCFLLHLFAIFVYSQMDLKHHGRQDGSIPNRIWIITQKTVQTILLQQMVCPGSR